MSSKMGHVGSKTRSLGQILEKHCSLMLYHTIQKAQVSDSRAIMDLSQFSRDVFNRLLSWVHLKSGLCGKELTPFSIYTHFNTLKKKALGKHCGKR